MVLIGSISIIAMPLLLPLLPLGYLKDFGTIGDAFGGISNPLSQIVGFVLLYLALKAQINANNILQQNILKENMKEMRQRELEQLHELYVIFERNIREFTYINRFEVEVQLQVLNGKRAIYCFVNDIEKRNIDLHNTEGLLQEDGVREIVSILKTAQLIFVKIGNMDVENDDKNFYINIMKHELVFSIFPYTDLDESAELKLPQCPYCHEYHGNYPPLIFDKL
ncbi:hypothetical protein ACM46_15140 [Chryseobacterium angstadtii]|uniref:Uncharacterized protein n=2 Tax=Chryseobacterium angstadtii TaxID=558151 RepID=A0A0J7I607_9FLAO|nr:hypothetical protein ACM46_15140 [Chryseobacterium angstadtii]